MVSPSSKQHCGVNLPSFKQFTSWMSSKLAQLLVSLYKVPRQLLWRAQHWCEDECCCCGEINSVQKLFGCRMFVKLQFNCLCCIVLKLCLLFMMRMKVFKNKLLGNVLTLEQWTMWESCNSYSSVCDYIIIKVEIDCMKKSA